MVNKIDGIYNTVCPRDCFGVCSIKVETKDGKIINVSGNKDNDNSEGIICGKGASYPKRLYHQDRLTFPMLRNKSTNKFNRISWDKAIELISDKLMSCKENYGTESVMYLSGWGHAGVFNDYAKSFWSQFGTVTSTFGSLCMAAGKAGAKYTYGNTVKHNHNSDLIKSKLIIVWGSNPANTNIHRMRYIKNAVSNGAKLIVIDPRVSETMMEGAVKIHPRCGTDALLAMGVAKLLIEQNVCNYEFIDKYIIGFEGYKNKLKEYSIDEISEKTEVDISMIKKIADEIAANPIFALVSGTGKSRYSNGGQTERAICLLPALTGSIGLSGGGYYFTDNQYPEIKWTFLPEKRFEMNPKIHVGNLAEEITIQNPKINFLWIEKANPLTSSPNINLLKKAIKEIDFIVCVEHFMTDTANSADLVLPAAMFCEKNDLIKVYGDSHLHLLQKIVDPYGESKSEPEIYRLLGEKIGLDLSFLPEVDETTINRLLQDNGINTNYMELSYNSYLTEKYKHIAFEDLIFDTPSGKIEIYSEQIEELNIDKLPEFKEITENMYSSPNLYKKYPIQFLSSHPMGRINSQFTEMQIDKKNSIPKVQININDAVKRNINNGDTVRIFNDRGEIELICEVGEKIRPGAVHIYEGWGEKYKASINTLTKGGPTDIGNGTVFHDCLVEISKL